MTIATITPTHRQVPGEEKRTTETTHGVRYAGYERVHEEQPVTEVGGRAVFAFEAMEAVRPYTFLLGGRWMMARKRRNGRIDFYRIPA